MGHSHAVFLEWQKFSDSLEWSLDEQEQSAKSHIKALRVKNGDHLLFLDGKGHVLESEILDSKNLRFKTLNHFNKEFYAPSIDVYLSAPRGDDLERSIQICVELGVKRLHLIHTDHCAHTSPPNLGRLVRVAQSSCEQSLNAWMPEIRNAFDENFDLLLEKAKGESHAVVFDEILADQKSPSFRVTRPAERYSIFVGPEGGWSTRERNHFDTHKIERASLGPTVLKVATALCVGISLLRFSHES